MEGMLWKWTNYFSGWQPRWFVLDNGGILSYYKSKDDVCNGSKGSLKVSACDVSVHHNDACRMDLIIPGEAHFYLRSATPPDRQKWVVALGTAKACVSSDIITSASAPIGKLPEDALKVKKSELRLYCDLLMQQVHGVKCAVENKESPNVELLNDSTSLLSATCDTFIQTLDDCVKMAHSKVDATLTESHLNSGATPNVLRTLSVDRHIPSSKASAVRFKSTPSPMSDSFELSPSKASLPSTPTSQNNVFFERNGSNSELEDEVRSTKLHGVSTTRVPTFFTDLSVSFLDVRLTNENDIPTVPFLDACRTGLQIFDRFNQTAFAPAKLDIAGNIRKIHQKYVSSPETFDTLQKILLCEMNAGQSKLTSSATLSLLWLNRSLQFINEFLIAFLAAGIEEDLTNVINTAYSKSLMEYHGWVVRGAFAMAVKSAPTRTDFINILASNPNYVDHPVLVPSVLQDMADYCTALTTHTTLLYSFFVDNGLNFADRV